jgi:uncharacterized membrane protein
MAEQGRAATGRRPSLAVGVVLGAAVMAAVDEIVFHQLLHWHHLVDRSTSGVALVSDGVLHALELAALVGGFVRYADLRRQGLVDLPVVRAAFVLGLGGFQLFDGVVDHKLLRIHQIRYGVDLLPYDLAWLGGGAVVTLIGIALLRRARR